VEAEARATKGMTKAFKLLTAIQQKISYGRRVLRFSGPNHINPRLHRIPPQLTSETPKPSPTNKPQWTALLAVPVEVS
jgi:glycerol-3-phosphate O-acyltransferase